MLILLLFVRPTRAVSKRPFLFLLIFFLASACFVRIHTGRGSSKVIQSPTLKLYPNEKDNGTSWSEAVDNIISNCSYLTPINYCAELTRLKHIGGPETVYTHTHNTVISNSATISKSFVEDVVRNGMGIKYSMDFEMEENGVQFNSHFSQFSPRNRTFEHNDDLSRIRTTASQGFKTTEPFIPFVPSQFFEPTNFHNKTLDQKERKLILWYAPTRYRHGLRGVQSLRGCPDFPCSETTDQRYVKRAAALIFTAELLPEWPPPRRHDQIFVLHNHEPQTQPLKKWRIVSNSANWTSVFNWTMSYRLDSDIISPYGLLRRKGSSIDFLNDASGRGHKSGRNKKRSHASFRQKRHRSQRYYAKIILRKRKLVAAMISNCRAASRRDDYIRQLSHYIPVDVFGQCGNMTCPRQNDSDCTRMISTTYKFFLAFENAFCEDYISEKFFRFLNADLVTVVRGSNQYFINAPSEIFLNVADYPSPRHLAAKLTHLDRNTGEYIKILEAKDNYVALYEDWKILNLVGEVVYHHYHYEAVPLCQLCHRLWNLEKYARMIPNATAWFTQKMCVKGEDVYDFRDSR